MPLAFRFLDKQLFPVASPCLGAFPGLENMLGAGVGQVDVPGELFHAQEYSQPTGNESWRVNDPALSPLKGTSMKYGLYFSEVP